MLRVIKVVLHFTIRYIKILNFNDVSLMSFDIIDLLHFPEGLSSLTKALQIHAYNAYFNFINPKSLLRTKNSIPAIF